MNNDLLWTAAYAGCMASIIIFFVVGETQVFASVRTQSASVFFVQSTTSEQIQNNYNNANTAKKVRILIVPGHQPNIGGTEFKDLYERDFVVDIANALAGFLSKNARFSVIVARDKTKWNTTLESYFKTHALEIETFMQSQKSQMQNYLANGSILPATGDVPHNNATATSSIQLYGINKWAGENDVDITLHLHLNDYVGHRANRTGEYDGFTIYVPDHQYSNAEASKAIAKAIAVRLNSYHATSTLPKEDTGVVEDQKLIAIGSNNSADNAALLIEYGYIYEPQFQEPSVRSVAFADYAYQTYLGLQDFFNDPIETSRGSISFPFDWTDVTAEKNQRGPGVYALQSALRHLGFYPPDGKSFSECPISGVSGHCTRSAISDYQEKHGLTVTGQLGPKTREALKRDLVVP